ncbi:MAG: leucine--tRNA ligase [Phycisphaerales bacterium]
MADESTPFRYDAALAGRIETSWQARWERDNAYRVGNPGDPGFDASRPKFYVLDMFPYPSGAGLHVGHPEGYTATDIVARHKRMQGFNVLHPMGWDAFGLPAEQYAVQTGVHPRLTTARAIDNFRRQLKRFGFCYDWSREFGTIDPGYVKWTQWIWLQAYGSWYDPKAGKARPIVELERDMAARDETVEIDGTTKPWRACSPLERQRWLDTRRLAYLGEQTVNWCPKLGTVLANEEVIDGRSERGGHPVRRLPLKQWMFRITAYADRLLEDLSLVAWPESTRVQQAEWIGRSEGAEIDFVVEGLGPLRVFTTRADTLFGATYMVVAPEHALVEAVAGGAGSLSHTARATLAAYVQASRDRADVDRQAESREKTGCFTGLHAVNPATGERIPVWTADYVLMGYGTGAIMAVPAHDERDFAFARAFDLPIRQVVEIPGEPWTGEKATRGEGVAVHSASAELSIDGRPTAQARLAVLEWLERTGRGTRRVNYRLRDWLFSRQRYWGEPFPVVFDEQGLHHPVAESRLPLTLPDLTDYAPIESDTPLPPLGKATGWVNTTAGEAGIDPQVLPANAKVRRETNTMPGWAGSCWYYLRYCDPANADRFVSREAERYWMTGPDGKGRGVDLYIGGNEHAVLHLLYARFWHKMLFDLGHVSTPEPFARLFHQGLITSHAYQRSDRTLVAVDQVQERGGAFFEKNGGPVTQVVAKMSKSLKNVINPDDVIAEYGADTFRLYEMSMGPLEASKPWNTRDIAGVFRFLQRAWRLAVCERTGELLLAAKPSEHLERLLHRATRKVGEDIDRLAFNTAIAALIEVVNAATRPTEMTDPTQGGMTREQLDRFIRLLAPFAPHMAEEIWSRLGHAESVTVADWPAFDPAMLQQSTVELAVQVAGKVKAHLTVPAEASAADVERLALAEPKIAELLGGRVPRKIVVVPKRLVNIVP